MIGYLISLFEEKFIFHGIRNGQHIVLFILSFVSYNNCEQSK